MDLELFENREFLVPFAALLVATGIDFRSRKIPNLLTFPLMLLGVIFGAYYGHVQQSLLGLTVGFGVMAVLFTAGAVGAGDAKLIMALGAWSDAESVLNVIVLSIFISTLFAVIRMIYQRRLNAFVLRAWLSIQGMLSKSKQPTLIDKTAKDPFAWAVLAAWCIRYGVPLFTH